MEDIESVYVGEIGYTNIFAQMGHNPMKRLDFSVFAVLCMLVVSLSGCLVWDVKEDEAGTPGAIIPGAWVHAVEEDGSDGVQVYRPERYRDFPAARFRMRYVFTSSGACEWLFLSPSDAHFMKSCTYRVDVDTLKVRQDTYEMKYFIHTSRYDLLRLEPLPVE